MSELKSSLLELAELPFKGDEYQDCFKNVTLDELTALQPKWEKFGEELHALLTSDDETKSNSIAHVYELYRKHFPIGDKHSELALLQIIGGYVRYIITPTENPLAALLSSLGGEA